MHFPKAILLAFCDWPFSLAMKRAQSRACWAILSSRTVWKPFNHDTNHICTMYKFKIELHLVYWIDTTCIASKLYGTKFFQGLSFHVSLFMRKWCQYGLMTIFDRALAFCSTRAYFCSISYSDPQYVLLATSLDSIVVSKCSVYNLPPYMILYTTNTHGTSRIIILYSVLV